MTRMTGPDCAVMCNLMNIHTYMHTCIPTILTLGREFESRCTHHTNRDFFSQKKIKNKNKKKAQKMENDYSNFSLLVHKIRLHGRRGKGTAESFSREKIRQAPQKEGG